MPSIKKKKISRNKKPKFKNVKRKGIARKHFTKKHFSTKKFTKKFKKSSRKSDSARRASLLNTLTVPNTISGNVAQQVGIVASDAILGKRCTYFVPNNSLPHVSLDPAVMAQIGYLITQDVLPQIKFHQTNYDCNLTLSNLSNTHIKIRAYLCEARRDVINVTGQNNIIQLLAQGFDLSADTIGTTLINNVGTTPFDSPSFAQVWKIIQTRTTFLGPGSVTHYAVHDRQDHTVRPSSDMTFVAAQTYDTGTILYAYKKGSKFWLFQGEVDKMGINSGTFEAANVQCDLLLQETFKYTYKWMDDTEPVNTLVQSGGYAAPGTVQLPIDFIVQTTVGSATTMTTV